MAAGAFKLDLKLSQWALILVAVPLVCQLIFVGALVFLLNWVEVETRKEQHYKEINSEANLLVNDFMNAGLAIHMYQMSESDTYMNRFRELAARIPVRIAALRVMLRDSQRPSEAFERVEKASNNGLRLLAEIVEVANESKEGGDWGSRRSELTSVTQAIFANITEFVREQEKADAPKGATDARRFLVILICVMVVGNIFVALALAFAFNRGATSRLKVLMDNIMLLSFGGQLHKPIGGGDEIGKLDDVFHQMAEELADAAARKQELMQMVAHDLRTPLTSIQASLSLMSLGILGELPEKAVKQVDVAEKSSSRLISLINDLLDIEKLEAGQMQMDPKDVDLEPVIQSAVEAVQEFANLKKVSIDVVQAGDTALGAHADGDRLVQVLVNLLSNAIKYSPADGVVTIETVAVQQSLAPKDMIEVRVIDQGRGVPPKYREAIFQRFQQVDISDSKEKKGTGLGLPICKAIVEAHGGKIGVESEPGMGSTFWFRVPAQSANSAAGVKKGGGRVE